MQWITNVNKSGFVSKETDNNLVVEVSVDQIQSDQPGLVPQLSGKLKSARIWADQVMVVHFSGLIYVHLIRSTIQEDILALKSAF